MTSRSERNRLFARRRFLQSAGATVATLPFLRALPGYAQADAQPKLILAFSGNGRIRHKWGADDSTGGLQLRENLAPLQPYAEHITITEGIRNFGAADIGGTHEGGTMSCFTGAGGNIAQDASNIGYPSIDTLFMAAQTGTALGDSFYQQVVADRNTSENAGPNNRIAFDQQGDRRDPWRSGWEAVDQYLAGAIATPDTESTGPDPRDLARTAMFENLNAQLGELENKLCSEDYRQMQAMRESIAQASSAMQRAVSCELPELPPRPNYEEWEPIWQPPGDPIELDSTSNWYYQRGHLASDLLVAALACGVTRAGVLQFDQGAGEAMAAGQAQNHHNTSHGVPQLNEFLIRYAGTTAADSSVGADYLQGDPNETDQYASYTLDYQENPPPALIEQYTPVWNDLSQWEVYYADQIAYLLGQLEAFGLLDDTALLWGSELDNGQHEHYNMPFLIASGPKLPFNRGTVVRYPLSYSQPDTRNIQEPLGAPRSHADLLQTVLKGVGVEVDSLGAPAYSTGILDQLLI